MSKIGSLITSNRVSITIAKTHTDTSYDKFNSNNPKIHHPNINPLSSIKLRKIKKVLPKINKYLNIESPNKYRKPKKKKIFKYSSSTPMRNLRS